MDLQHKSDLRQKISHTDDVCSYNKPLTMVLVYRESCLCAGKHA